MFFVGDIGGTYTITSELIDLEKEATVKGAEAAFNGTEKSLNTALNDIVRQIIGTQNKQDNTPSSSHDRRACEYAKKEESLETWEMYLKKFPDGECAFEAESKIGKMKKKEEEASTPKTCVQKYKKEAEKGDADAQKNLGNCYYNGDGTPKDYNEAFKWYSKATEYGDMYARYNLGLCYEFGLGTSKDLNEARKLYEKAAAQGHPQAQERLKLLNNFTNTNSNTDTNPADNKVKRRRGK